MFVDEIFSVPQQDYKSSPKFSILRSFNANKNGTDIENLTGGVVGGSLICGILKIGDEIEIRPGVLGKDENQNLVCYPILSRITSLKAEDNSLQYAVPGGLIGVGTDIDPSLCQGDKLMGQFMGLRGQLPDICTQITIKYHLINKLLGVKNVQNISDNGGM